MSQSVPSSPLLPPSTSFPVFGQGAGIESIAAAISNSQYRSVVITFAVTLPVPTTYEVAITGDTEGLGFWSISKPLYLRRKSPLEYTGRIKFVIPEGQESSTVSPLMEAHSGGSISSAVTVTETFNSSVTSSKRGDYMPIVLVNHNVLQALFASDFVLKYKYITLLDGCPMSWETANRKICLKWWLDENCECKESVSSPSELSNGSSGSFGSNISSGSQLSNPSNGSALDYSGGRITSPVVENKNKFVQDKSNPAQLLLLQNDGVFGSSSLRKFGKSMPSLFKPVDSEWIYDNVQLRIYQPTDASPRLNEEDILVRVNGKKTRLSIVDIDTYVISAPDLESLSFQVNIHNPDNLDVIKAVAFITHEVLQRKDVGEICVPFIDTKSFKIVGHFRALFLLVKPFKHPDNNLRRVRRTLNWEQQSHMKNPESKSATKFIGHRGLGKSVSSKNRALISENSMLSFQRSAAVGVDYIEFDVQLTKDLQPVIFHDFVAKIRVDDRNIISIPVQDLTLKQLTKLGMRLKPSFDDANVKRLTRLMEQRKHKLKRSNSYDHLSTSTMDSEESRPMQSAWSISEAFATLRECFEKIPFHVGFNIEIKWPIDHNVLANPNVPRNTFIDHILKCVFDHAGPRHIMFSSFDPDICTLLNLKQPKYPVFFLTEAGVVTFADHRCNSIPAAISFAKAIGLRGIVADCTPIIKNPNWIQMVHEHDLMIATFGEANSLPENIKIQQDMGIDAIICDNIDRILKNRKRLSSEGIDIDPQHLLTGEPNRLSQWVETIESSTKVEQ